MWRGIVGKGFTIPQFEQYLSALKFTTWRPRFVVVHNTAAPTREQWMHGKTPPHQRILNLENYFKNERKWSAGPHLFVAPDLIWVFTPLTVPGVHSPSWNGISWGVEVVGDFDREDFEPSKRNTVAALALMHSTRGLDPNTLRFHKEDPKTTHACPGKNMVKSKLIASIEQAMMDHSPGEHSPLTAWKED